MKIAVKNSSLDICDCGIANYSEILDLQLDLHKKRIQNQISNTALLVEHNPVITLGARKSANKLLAAEEQIKKQNIDIVEIRRGGGVTAHNPGQLLFYPIIHLKDFGLGINEYIRKLEQVGIELLEKFDINVERKKGYPGLWVNGKKIASIGVRVVKSVTYHGMAINIKNDLSIFELFVPCGLDGVEITSVLDQTSKDITMADAKQKLSEILKKHFAINDQIKKLPPWLKRPLPAGQAFQKTDAILRSLNLDTICSNANCPNKGECWNNGTATVLILGNTCTRNCKFCSVNTGKPLPPDPTEPKRLAQMAKQMNLKYLVITSVNRDDLSDGGASHFRDCILEVRKQNPDIKFEILTPDFKKCQAKSIDILSDAMPFVFAHNVETVSSLYPLARAGSDYKMSLNLLKIAKQKLGNIQTKSSIMLGLGETDKQIEQVLTDLRNVHCDRITIGQYLKPSKTSLDVVQYITPQRFDELKQKTIQLGFTWVCSSPFARSSYHAELEKTQ